MPDKDIGEGLLAAIFLVVVLFFAIVKCLSS